jgi:aspartyl-tRNA(Asn)/glutamyl-tRNA(Gln) amidotransferase subunit A
MSVNKFTVIEAIDALKTKKTSSRELVESCYQQIDQNDAKVKAFLTLNKEPAIKAASAADDLIAKEGPAVFEKFPLLGIPYAAKDNFSTVGIETTASSNILKGYITPYESTVTKRLQTAGAILLGKTNMDAFAHGSSTETSDFQTTLNPHDLTRVAGGSSGGSAAAVATDMCVFAIGTETSGSIRGPASWCGITGLKPTYGRVSRYGVIAMASSTDSPGPMCKTAEDCSVILQVIAGKDEYDATSSPNPLKKYVAESKNYSLKGKKIGKPKSYFTNDLESAVHQSVDGALKEFEKLGATVVDIDLIDPKYSIAVYTILQRSEVSSNLARFDGIRFGHDRTQFGFEAKKRMMLGAYTLSAGYYDQYYAKAQRVRTLLVQDFAKAFDHVDLIVGPMMPCVALKVGEGTKNPMFGEMMDVLASPSSIAGLTGISVPCGYDGNLPIGMQILGPMFHEAEILSASYNYQQVSNFHSRKPIL